MRILTPAVKRWSSMGVACAMICLMCAWASADEKAAPADAVSFRQDIAPILIHQCQSCHGPKKSKGKFRLDTLARLKNPGAGKGMPIVPGHPEQSEIYNRL